MIYLQNPWLGAIALIISALALWRHVRGAKQRRGKLTLATLTLVLLAATAAAAGLEWRTQADLMAVVYVLDRSRSASSGEAEAEEAILASFEERREGDVAGLVVFADSATTEAYVGPAPPLQNRSAVLARDETDIADGIRHGVSAVPSGYAGRIVLISDGLETHGDALAAAALAAARGMSIDVLPVHREARPELSVERVRVAESARPGEPVEVRIVTNARQASPVRLQLLRDGEPLAETETELSAGRDVLVFRDIAPEAGVHRYDAVLTPQREGDDESAANNRGGAFMRVAGGSRALLVSSAPAANEVLTQVLRARGASVDAGDVSALPADAAGLASYDLVVLHDVPARSLSEAQMRGVRSYVRSLGGGFLMAGARQSFGLGGYVDTPVEEALPARFDLRQRRDRLSLSMIIAIDRSGSMGAPAGSGTKLDLANEAAARSASMLSVSDRVGVMHVDTSVSWTVPMTAVEDPGAIASRVRRAQAGGGGIYVDITLESSYATLTREPTQLKHLLLFSDGSDSAQLGGTRAQVRTAASRGITTSVVSMGRGVHTAELEVLSRLGGGRFYIVEDMRELPRIFTQETMEASRAALSTDAFDARPGAPSVVTRGLRFADAPPLLGHAVVAPRSSATHVLWAGDDEPLLSTWQYGLGKSAVLTIDLAGEFNGPWTRWDGYATLLDQTTRFLERGPQSFDVEVGVHLRGGDGHVFVDAIDAEGAPIDGLALDGTLADPSGEGRSVTFQQAGPGRYEATFDASQPGPYLISVADIENGGFIGSAGVVRSGGLEQRGEGTDYALLRQIAALSGGEVLESLDAVFQRRSPPVTALQTLVPMLLMLSLVLLVLSVAMRRLRLAPRGAKTKSSAASTSSASGTTKPRATVRASATPKNDVTASVSASPSPREELASTEEAGEEQAESPATLAEQLLKSRRKR